MSETVNHFSWRKNLLLFALTVWSVFVTGRSYVTPDAGDGGLSHWYSGWTFAVPLLIILLAHEFGHYIAARRHGVPASLPYFLPLPSMMGSPFGTLGAVILMPGRIRSARALLDIGAAGPLAGMLVALPMMVVGLKLSSIAPRMPGNFMQEGQSLLYLAVKRLTLGPIPATHDVYLHPTAFAAWAGFFVTSLNLLPFMQLDGGHVAYALFGKSHDVWSRRAWWVPAAMLIHNAYSYVLPVMTSRTTSWSPAISSISLWGTLLVLMLVFRRFGNGVHPPVDDSTLGRGRTVVAVATLLLAILLFMPSPLVAY